MAKIMFLLLTVVSIVDYCVFADMDINVKPEAAKLTINIDSVAQRIPPQIAYFIPDRLLNATNFGINFTRPSIVDLLPPYSTINRTSFGSFNTSDLMASSQHPYRFYVPNEKHQNIFEEEPDTAFQNFNYQIDYKKIPDKRPDFSRFQNYLKPRPSMNKNKLMKSVKQKRKHIKKPVYGNEEHFNYANNAPNVRNRIKFIKMNHRDKFEIKSNHREMYENDNNEDSDDQFANDDDDSEMADRTKVLNSEVKMRKARKKYHQHKKPYHSWTKLSQPMSSENESSYNDDNSNMDQIEMDGGDLYDRMRAAVNHKDCGHSGDSAEEQLEPVDYDFVEQKPTKKNHHPKGFSIYLTKVMQKPHRSLRMDVDSEKKKNEHVNFVPTRILASTRKVEAIVHKPRKLKKPTMRERLRESGGHVVYSEDGYEDGTYDHGKKDKSLSYLHKSRPRRSTKPLQDLRGQELIDHLGDLIKNVSDYLNSSEIIPDLDKKKFPLYNNSDPNIQESAIKYSEHAKPVVEEVDEGDYPTELYKSKTKNCSDELEDVIDLSYAHNDTSDGRPKKRLGNLSEKLECLKEKLFGENPFDNPLFDEETVAQPQVDNVIANSMLEAESIQAIATVYDDVMDNIKQHSRNENQRIFSDYGITDSYALATINAHAVRARPENDLNLGEKYPDDYKSDKYRDSLTNERLPLNSSPPLVTASPLAVFNTFNNPAQVPILDISKFIPKTFDPHIQTDFVPIVSPSYNNEEYQQPIATPTTNSPPPKVNRVHLKPVRKIPQSYLNANSNNGNSNNSNNNANRNQQQQQLQQQPNVIILRRRLPISLLRRIPKNA